jgi:uncharacterized protein with ParB-like and HNH nuclease domain
MSEVSLTENLKAEEESYTDDALYNITSFGTDIMLSQIVTMYENGDIEKPDLQRNYVWTKAEASRFIDSILLGLPVPSIFLAKDKDNRLQIVDGLQRITTICDYFRGVFSLDNSVFKLSNRENIYFRWRNKAYSELSEAEKRAIRTYSIHAIVFEQKKPSDNSGMYQIFERINTGGRVLKPQEIRNSVYHGSFNNLLKELNKISVWRSILGSENPDTRMSDIELVLRFFAFIDLKNRDEYQQKQINLVKYLNTYMSDHVDVGLEESEKFKSLFFDIITFINSHLGSHAFRAGKIQKDGSVRWAKKVNPVIFDAVCTATYLSSKMIQLPDKLLDISYEQLVTNEEFIMATTQRTTNIKNIKKRTEMAAKILYDVDI